jgi:hypothetical protein
MSDDKNVIHIDRNARIRDAAHQVLLEMSYRTDIENCRKGDDLWRFVIGSVQAIVPTATADEAKDAVKDVFDRGTWRTRVGSEFYNLGSELHGKEPREYIRHRTFQERKSRKWFWAEADKNFRVLGAKYDKNDRLIAELDDSGRILARCASTPVYGPFATEAEAQTNLRKTLTADGWEVEERTRPRPALN